MSLCSRTERPEWNKWIHTQNSHLSLITFSCVASARNKANNNDRTFQGRFDQKFIVDVNVKYLYGPICFGESARNQQDLSWRTDWLCYWLDEKISMAFISGHSFGCLGSHLFQVMSCRWVAQVWYFERSSVFPTELHIAFWFLQKREHVRILPSCCLLSH